MHNTPREANARRKVRITSVKQTRRLEIGPKLHVYITRGFIILNFTCDSISDNAGIGSHHRKRTSVFGPTKPHDQPPTGNSSGLVLLFLTIIIVNTATTQ
jgi:hypothetical protein